LLKGFSKNVPLENSEARVKSVHDRNGFGLEKVLFELKRKDVLLYYRDERKITFVNFEAIFV